MRKAKLFKKLAGGIVRCTACQRYCQINQGEVGFCRSRKNIKGELYSLTYGFSSGIQIDPIEKKPLYHFYPGSEVLSIGSFGCNFRCKQCQNWQISYLNDLSGLNKENVSPKRLVKLAKVHGCPGIAFTYNEPSIWPEFVYDSAVLAKQNGLFTVFISNGSWSKEALAYYGKYLDAANIDLKGWGKEVYQRQNAYWGNLPENLILAYKKYQIFLELTTLLIPGINDQADNLEKIASFIVNNLSPEIPWHLSRFSPENAPDPDFQKIPATPIKTLKKAYQIGKKSGLKNIYIWAPATVKDREFLSFGDSFCPKCQKMVVKRNLWQPQFRGLEKFKDQVRCLYCRRKLYFKF
jgi:pyruvate formate lyase activating enzyme